MHTIEPYFQSPPNIYDPFIKTKIFKSKASSPSIKKLELKLNISFPRKSSFFEISRDSTHINQVSPEGSKLQAKYCLSCIEDPLWKSVCSEMADLMGSSPVEKVWGSKLGTFCSEGKSIDLCCPTDEAAQFVDQYSFLILGILQRYFPTIKTLKTKVEYAN